MGDVTLFVGLLIARCSARLPEYVHWSVEVRRGEVELRLRVDGREIKRSWTFEMLSLVTAPRLELLADEGFEQMTRALRPPFASSPRG